MTDYITDRPKIRLKYDVIISIGEDIISDPPNAIEIYNDVNMPNIDIIEYVKRQVGKVILATSGLTSQNEARVIDTELRESEVGNTVEEGAVHLVVTYVIDAVGLGSATESVISAKAVRDMYEVLVLGNNSPIERSQAIREFRTGPLNVEGIYITTN